MTTIARQDLPQLETVVLGTDFSAPSCATVRWVGRRLAPSAELVVVHSIELPDLPGFLGGELPHRDEIEATLRAGATDRLAALRAELEPARVRTEVQLGRPVDQLAVAAAHFEADLIAVGKRGAQRGLWRLLGSTAEGLLHRSPLPILVCHDPLDRPPRTVLVALDESEPARAALDWGLGLASAHEAQLVVLHVVTDWYARQVERIGSRKQSAVVLDAMAERARGWLRDSLAEVGGEDLQVTVRTGDVVRGILDEADAVDADLLILGGTGSGRHGGGRLGGVARAVLQAAHRPLLIVPGAYST